MMNSYKYLIGISIVILFTGSVTSASIAEEPSTSDNMLSLVYIEKATDSTECHRICGCDQAYIYNETINECVLNLKYIMMTVLKEANEEKSEYKYNADHDIANDDGMGKNIRIEAGKIFTGIIISVIIFVVCAILCVLSACIYCCHINYSDRKLKKDLEVMARKLNKNYTKRSEPKTKLQPMQESCNVVVGNAGVFVV